MTKAERLARAKELIKETVDSTIASFAFDEIKQQVHASIKLIMRNGIMDALGVEDSWGKLRVHSQTPLKNKMREIISELTGEIKFVVPILTDKENKTGYFVNGNCSMSVYRFLNRPLSRI